MWYNEAVFYQIYPLGMCGAPSHNPPAGEPDEPNNRIMKIKEFIPHIKEIGATSVLLNPIFNSDSHGYDTRDFKAIDPRLGDNACFTELCGAFHEQGIKVVLDGVFNHVGRGFWAFRDVLEKREQSEYKYWFHIDFNRNNNYNDGLWYDGWEGHFELVRLNLYNDQLVNYLLDCVTGWIKEFDIDGLRLDVAYCLEHGFIRRLREHVCSIKNDFFLVGEMLHGDYSRMMHPDMLHSVTNYECYKGLYSSLNAVNLFEIAYSLNRQFGPEQWTLYKGLHLFNFVDNHDVTRAASVLNEKRNLPLLYGMLFGMPGIPCVYYGSEWGETGVKGPNSDAVLRPAYDKPLKNELSDLISKMSAAHKGSDALINGDYRQIYLTNSQFIFQRKTSSQRILVALNSDSSPHTAHFNASSGTAKDLITGETADFGGGLDMPPFSVSFLDMEVV